MTTNSSASTDPTTTKPWCPRDGGAGRPGG
jgi:hypothetical protein